MRPERWQRAVANIWEFSGGIGTRRRYRLEWKWVPAIPRWRRIRKTLTPAESVACLAVNAPNRGRPEHCWDSLLTADGRTDERASNRRGSPFSGHQPATLPSCRVRPPARRSRIIPPGAALACSVLVLNRLYMAVHIVNVRRAFGLLCRELAEVIHPEDGKFATYSFDSWRETSELRAEANRRTTTGSARSTSRSRCRASSGCCGSTACRSKNCISIAATSWRATAIFANTAAAISPRIC